MLFNIYDGRNPQLLVDTSIDIEASNARQALQKYLDNRNESNIKFHNTADNNVIWKTTPIRIVDGRKCLAGRISWWGINTRWEVIPDE